MAKRPNRSSKTRRAVRPPVIDLKAEETKAAEAKAAGANPSEDTKAAGARVNPAASPDKPAKKADDHSSQSKKAPGAGAPTTAAADGRGKMIAGGLALLVLAAVVLGGWLYRDYGSRFFGSRQSASLSAVEDRLGALEAAAKANAGKLVALDQRISSAEAKIVALEASIGSQQGVGQADLAAVQKSVAELRSALSAASGQESGAGQAANKIEIDKLGAQLAGIGERIGKAETAIKSVDASGLESKLAAIETELGSVKAQQNQLATQTRSELGEAFAKLSSSVAGSAPFGAELDALAAEAPAVPGLDVLRALAMTGVTSTAELADALDKMAASAGEAKADPPEASDGGIMSALKARLSTVVKIRKLDEADWPAVLTKAAKQVRDGQIDQALDLTGSQPGEAPAELADWRKKAEVRLTADRAMAQLSRAVLSRLAATGQSG